MAVNGVEIKVGQVWADSFGARIYIAAQTGKPIYCWVDSEGCTYTDKGFFMGSNFMMWNLVNLLSEPVDSASGPSGDSTQATTFGPLAANDSGVGDITSDAKGSGARFNSGKVPYELVPLELMAIHYEQLILLSLPIDAAPCTSHNASEALLCLGAFQARRADGALLDVLIALGDGWEDCARVFEYGSRKYAAWNWSRGMAWSVPLACAARHLQSMIRGEVNDPESGKPHRGHVYANICMLWTYTETFVEGDDRPSDGALADNEVYL